MATLGDLQSSHPDTLGELEQRVLPPATPPRYRDVQRSRGFPLPLPGAVKAATPGPGRLPSPEEEALEKNPISPADLLTVAGSAPSKITPQAGRILPWLVKTAPKAAATFGGFGVGSDLAEGRNPLPGLPGNLLMGGVLGPASEIVLGAPGAAVRDLTRRGTPRPGLARGAAPAPAVAPEPMPTPVAVAGLEPPAGSITPTLPMPEPPAPTQTRTAATGGTVPQVFKPGKLAAEIPEQEHLRKTLEALGMDTRRVRSFDDMKAAAQEFGLDPEVLLQGAARRPISDAEVVASANLINEQSAVHAEAIKKLADPAISDVERLALQRIANRAQDLIERAVKRRVRGGTESGRSVAAFRIIGERNLDPTYWFTIAQRQLGDRPLTPEIQAAIQAALTNQDRLALARLMSVLGRPDGLEKVITLVRAGLLTNPATDVRNVVSGNIGGAVLEHAKDIPASLIDQLYAIASGQRAKLLPSRLSLAQEAKGLAAGVRKAGEVIKWGDTEERILARYDFNRDVHFDNRLLELYTQFVFRRLGAQDALMREPAKFRAIAELAQIEAKNAGLRGRAFLDRVRDLIQNPTPRMQEIAEFEGAYRTFSQKSRLADGIAALERAGDMSKIAVAITAMFKRTPINVGKFIVEYSPFGVPQAAYQWARTNRALDPFLRQRYFVETMGRAVTGSTIFALGWKAAESGLAIGGPADKPRENDPRQAQGIPNYSVKLGDQYIGINNNAPTSNIFMAGVDAYEQFQKNPDLASRMAGVGASQLKGLTEQTFLRGVKSTGELLSRPKTAAGSWLEGVVAMLVPSLLGAVARGTDPLERKIEGPVQAVMAKVPGLRERLEPQITASGEPRKQQAGVLSQMLSPVRVATPEKSAAAEAAKRTGYAASDVDTDLSTTKQKDKRLKLAGEARTRFEQEVRRAQDQAIAATMNEPDFKTADEDEQRNRLDIAVKRATTPVVRRWRDELLNPAAAPR